MRSISLFLVSSLFLMCSCAGKTSVAEAPADRVRIPAGPFTMGMVIENDMEWGDTDEEPVHEVTLSEFFIDRYEVSARDYAAFLNAHPKEAPRYIEMGPAVTIELVNGAYRPRPGLEAYPANRVSWYGADAYCRWKGQRLPTEAEWEKAARGIDERPFPWGDTFPHNDFVTFRRKFSKYGFDAMKPVDAMPEGRSPYGLHHMAGNVWEWTADWYSDTYYEDSPAQDPQGPETGISKVLRGGNWYFKAYYMRTTYRFNERPEVFKVWQGFRCASSPEGRRSAGDDGWRLTRIENPLAHFRRNKNYLRRYTVKNPDRRVRVSLSGVKITASG